MSPVPPTIKALEPELGEPGHFAWIAVDVLDADPAYQREVNTRRGREVTAKIAREFRWSRFGVLHVAPSEARADDDKEFRLRFWVLDGLHRLEGAKARGGVTHVPCWIDEALSNEDRAAIFLAINRDRVALHAFAIHRALVTAGDASATAIERVCKASGVSIPPYVVHRRDLKPGQTLALASIRMAIERCGEPATVRALRLQAAAWSDRAGEIRALSIKGVARLVTDFAPIDDVRLTAALRAIPMDQREIKARDAQLALGQAADAALALQLAQEIAAAKKPPAAVGGGVVAPHKPRAVANAVRQPAPRVKLAKGHRERMVPAVKAPAPAKPKPEKAPAARRPPILNGELLAGRDAKVLKAIEALGPGARNDQLAARCKMTSQQVSGVVARLRASGKLRIEYGNDNGAEARQLIIPGSKHDARADEFNDPPLGNALATLRRADDVVVRDGKKQEWRVNGRETLDRNGIVARAERIDRNQRLTKGAA